MNPKTILLFFFVLSVSNEIFCQTDCRLKPEDLQPVISRYNPFFANHTWDQDGQIEMARLGDNRLLVITQDGCKRHHTVFNMVIEKEAVENNKDFWVEEVKTLFHKTYWENSEYQEFGKNLNEQFADKFAIYGFNNTFNFPVGTRNFICQIQNDKEKGGRIRIEMVTFIFRESVKTRRNGIPEGEDDGWLKN